MKPPSNGAISYALRYAPFWYAVGVLATLLMAGPLPAAGFSLGGLLSYGSLLAASLMIPKTLSRRSAKLTGISRLQLLLLAKLPLFAIVIFFTNSLGLKALEGFLMGYLLVYFVLVLGAFFIRDAPSNTSDEQR